MITEWKSLPTMTDVAKAKADGWEIWVMYPFYDWGEWDCKEWSSKNAYRGRPRQPKMKKVKQLCFFSVTGLRYDILENGEQHKSFINCEGWTRVPSEDKEIEIPDDN